MKKRFALWLSILLVFGLLTTEVIAAAPLEMDRAGSVTVTMVYQDMPLEGSELTLYRIASVQLENQADYSVRLTGEFAESGLALADLSKPETAAAFAEYASAKGLEGVTQVCDENGKITFRDLELGLFLLVQAQPVEGFAALSPFLVTVPGKENDEYIYDVDASPKMSLEALPTEPTEPTEPTVPPEPELPQTGLVQWPIPVMAVGGLLLVVLGWSLCVAGKGKADED